MAGAEVVECDHAAEAAQVLDRAGETGVFGHRLFHHFDDDAARIDVRVFRQFGQEVAEVAVRTAAEHFRVDVQEEPAVMRVLRGVVVHVQVAAQLVEVAQVVVTRGAGDDAGRRDRVRFRVGGAQQTFVTDGATVRNAEYGLEVAGEGQAFVAGQHAVCAVDDVGAGCLLGFRYNG